MPSESPPPPERTAPFLTVSEAARRLRLSPTSVQMLVERGLLKAWRTAGGHRRIVPSSVDDLLRERGVGGAADAAGAPAIAAAAAPAAPGATAADAPFDILVAEDDPDLLALYRTRLRRTAGGVQLRVAEDGVRALLAIGEKAPDLLILDVDLPGINGVEALKALRADPRTARMPVVVVSGLPAAQLAALGGLPPGTVALPKPIPFERLQGCVEAFAAARRLGAV